MREPASARSGNFFPWCSTALAGLFVAVSLWASGAAPPLLAEAEQHLAAAEANWLKHPYLEPGALLHQRLGDERIGRARTGYDALHGADPPTPPGVLRREQSALDDRVAAAAAPLEQLPARRFGVDPFAWRYPTLLTHVPIHGGLAHLFGNAVLLLFLGIYLESAWGRPCFLGIAALAAAGTAAGYAIALPGSARPWVGSSGLLAGLLPVFALHYWKARGDGFFWVGLVMGALWLALPPIAGWQWSLDAPGASLLSGTLPPVASFGAYGGAAICALAGHQLLRMAGVLSAFDPEDDGAAQKSSTPDAARVAKLRASGRLEDAFVQANGWARREPDSLDAVLTLRDAALALKRAAAARTALLRAVRLELKAGLLAGALDHWHELSASGVPREAEPAMLIRLATLLHETDDREGARRALRAAIANAGEASRAVVAGRVARAAREIDPQIAHDAAWRGLQQPEIELEERQALEELLGEVIPRLPREIEAPGAVAQSGAGGRPAPIEIETNVRVLDAVESVPIEIDDEGIHFTTQAGQKKLMRYDRIEAVSVAAVQGLSEKPVLIVDLVLDWKARGGDRLRVIRMRADRFDPRRVVPGAGSAVEALRQMVTIVLSRSKGVPLPDPDAARGMPFASFPELALYQRLVLLAEGPLQPPSPPPPPKAQAHESAAPAPPAPQRELPEPVIEEPGAGPPEFWDFKA